MIKYFDIVRSSVCNMFFVSFLNKFIDAPLCEDCSKERTEINNAILICHHLFQKEAVDDGQQYFEEIPTEPPTNRYFSDLMDRKIIN